MRVSWHVVDKLLIVSRISKVDQTDKTLVFDFIWTSVSVDEAFSAFSAAVEIIYSLSFMIHLYKVNVSDNMWPR